MKHTLSRYPATLRSLAVLASLSLAGSSSAFATLLVTNGDFETGTGNNLDDVSGWFDPSNGTFWQGSWQTNSGGIIPAGSSVVVLGSYESGGIQNTASADVSIGN